MQDYLEIRELYHYGIKGQKWGERRFQNPDGTLTKEGIARYRTDVGTKEMIKNTTDYNKLTRKQQRQYINYGKVAGAKKGAIIGGVAGAGVGITRAIIGIKDDKKQGFRKTLLGGFKEPRSGESMVKKVTRSGLIGALGGAIVGTIMGGHAGKRGAKAHLADKGKDYVDELLDTPVDRLHHSDDLEMSEISIDEAFIEHHGILNQKWGIRRYQNEDGTLTEEGRKRYNKDAPDKITREKNKKTGEVRYFYKTKDEKGNEIEKPYKYKINQLDDNDLKDLNARASLESKLAKDGADADKREKESIEKAATQPYKDTRDILDSSAKVLDATARALPTGNGKTIRKDYSNMSDQELRTKISRLQLEESYGKLSGDTKYVKSGSEKAKEILQTTGAVLAIGMSAAALAETISRIRAKKQSTK